MVNNANISIYIFALCTFGFHTYEFFTRSRTKTSFDIGKVNNRWKKPKFVLKSTSGALIGILTTLVTSMVFSILLPTFSGRLNYFYPFITLGFDFPPRHKMMKNDQMAFLGVTKLIYLLAVIILSAGYSHWFRWKRKKEEVVDNIDNRMDDLDHLLEAASQDSILRPGRVNKDDRAAETADKPVKNNWTAMRRNSQVPHHFSSTKGLQLAESQASAYENARTKYYQNQKRYFDRAMGKATPSIQSCTMLQTMRQSRDENGSTRKTKEPKKPSRSYVGGPSADAYNAAKDYFYRFERDENV